MVDEPTSIKPTIRKTTVVKRQQTKNENVQISYFLIKLLILNFFITPLLFLLCFFLFHENVNILFLFNISEKNEIFTSAFSTDIYNFLFKRITQYNFDLKDVQIYILFYRWAFFLIFFYVTFYNIRILKDISKFMQMQK